MTLLHKKQLGVLSLDAAFILVVIFAVPIVEFMFDKFPECFLLQTTGLQCHACGGTRCVYSMASGDFVKAFSYNPMIFLGVIYVAVIMILLNLSRLFGLRIATKLLTRITRVGIICTFLGLLFAFGIVRNFI